MGNSSYVRITDRNRMPQVRNTLRQANGASIKVGIWGGGKMELIASVQEFGCRIPVTEKMRKYLHSQGLHLKPSTTEIVIPERSFIRAGWDENEGEINRKYEELIEDVFEQGISASAFLDAMGQEARDRIRDYARDLRDPANHPFTIEKKSSSNPLVDSGDMIQAIDYEVNN